MSAITEIPAAPVESQEEIEKKQHEDVVKALDATQTEYNTSVEAHQSAEDDVQTAEASVFKVMIAVAKSGTTADSSYNDVFMALVEKKSEAYAAQTASYRLLMKLRNQQTTYLQAVVQGLQQKLQELSPAAPAVASSSRSAPA